MKNFKAIAGILLVFFLGAAGGALATYMIYQARLEHFISGGHKMREDVIVERLTRELNLDSLQKGQVKAITHEAHEGIVRLKNQIHPQIEALLTASQERIKAVLRPDQREKFDRIIAERKQRKSLQGGGRRD
ncbi:hypothetical protein [Geobacter sp. AOG2]|uniref:hypothetical protein n=1 Tax=Geobacter sp. AOG2 TaxID=1566347 RepID=UPI001CC3DBB0|nr:hypothetical protein [Geobacter sp. AOG2]GFE62239.1 hypothetical protein AOG2_28270 [Geobacter sp. AOG2]